MIEPSEAQVAYRFVIAQSWWVASELVRRNPSLLLIETHPGGGQYDCLSLFARSPQPTKVVDLNRRGRIHVTSSSGISTFEPITWGAVLNADNPHETVKAIEAAAKIDVPKPTPATGPAVITYRAISHLMNMLVNHKDTWDVRSEFDDTSGAESGPRGYVANFPTAANSAREVRPTDLFGVPQYRYWALIRNDDPVAIFDTDGIAHVDGSKIDLLAAYEAYGRRLVVAVADSIGNLLP